MTDIETLKALRERCRVAGKADRKLDVAIATALVPDVLVAFQRDDGSGWDPYTHWTYTGSVDAALALVERLLPMWAVWNIGQEINFKRWNAALVEVGTDGFTGKSGEGKDLPTPALALIAAALSARIAEMEGAAKEPAG